MHEPTPPPRMRPTEPLTADEEVGPRLTKEPLLQNSGHRRGDGNESLWEQVFEHAALAVQVAVVAICWLSFSAWGKWGYLSVAAGAWPYLKAMHSTVIQQGPYRMLLNIPISLLIAWSLSHRIFG